ISLGGPVFDLQKLTWLNGVYLRDLDDRGWLSRLRGHLLSDDYLLKVLPLVRERVDKLEDFVDYAGFFFTGKVESKAEELVPKGRAAADLRKVLDGLIDTLDGLVRWEHTELEATLRAYCEKAGWKSKELFMPLRLAVTGRAATPPLFETMAVLGKE